jgi:hypothetical protein
VVFKRGQFRYVSVVHLRSAPWEVTLTFYVAKAQGRMPVRGYHKKGAVMQLYVPFGFEVLAIAMLAIGFSAVASADQIAFSGNIIQSTQDGTGPAVNNPSLNNIGDLQAYSVTLIFAGSITTPGNSNLTGSLLTFSDPAAPASEMSFGSISLTITANAGFDEFSVLACLTAGSGCAAGNQLDANFKIPATMLNSHNVPAIGLDQPHPLDLLEDDGITDIQGSITTYTGPASAVPEPSSAMLLGYVLTALAAMACRLRGRRQE